MELGLVKIYDGTKDGFDESSSDHRTVDVIAVHGLGAHRDHAWIRKKDPSIHMDKDVNWLTDLLPLTLRSGNPSIYARIFCFNYESKWFGSDLAKQRLTNIANNMLVDIENERNEPSHRNKPLILIGHSFGGLVIEKLVVLASVDQGPHSHLVDSIGGIILLGTPHRGSGIQGLGSIISIAAKVISSVESGLIGEADEKSMDIYDMVDDFVKIMIRKRHLESRAVICFFENKETNIGRRLYPSILYKTMVVGEKSATFAGAESLSLDSDHYKLNKFATVEEQNYKRVSSSIYRIATGSAELVKSRKAFRTLVQDDSNVSMGNMECMRALLHGVTDPQSDYDSICSAKRGRIPGSCEWILSQDKYVLWRVEKGPRLLWLRGEPGIGKTVISLFLVEEFVNLARQSPAVTVAHFFCDAQNHRRRTATSILRGLLIQILRQRPALFKHIKEDFRTRQDALFDDFYGLWRILSALLKDPEVGQVYCIVDALDECEGESVNKLLTELTGFFSTSRVAEQVSVKFMIASRPSSSNEEFFLLADPKALGIQLNSEMVSVDVNNFIDQRIDEISRKMGFTEQFKKVAKDALKAGAEGTFLWASLVIDELRQNPCFDLEMLSLPKGIFGVYDRILSKIDDTSLEQAKQAQELLKLVVIAREPLTRRELAMALILASGRGLGNNTLSENNLDNFQNAFKNCQSLLYHDKHKDTVKFVHLSANDYLQSDHLKENAKLLDYHVDVQEANFFMSKVCWRRYLIESLNKEGSLFPDLPLRSYAQNHYISHATASREDLFSDFEWADSKNVTPIIDNWLLEEARQGRSGIVKLLLDHGANPRVCEDRSEFTPLHLAAMNGHEKVARVLLNGRANVNGYPETARDYDGALRLPSWSPIRVLIATWDSDYDDHYFSICGDKTTPLHLAAASGHNNLVRLLLSKGADILALDKRAFIALQLATTENQEIIARQLLWKVALIYLLFLLGLLGPIPYQISLASKLTLWTLSSSCWILYFAVLFLTLMLSLIRVRVKLLGAALLFLISYTLVFHQFWALILFCTPPALLITGLLIQKRILHSAAIMLLKWVTISLAITLLPLICIVLGWFYINSLISWLPLFLFLKLFCWTGIGAVSWRVDAIFVLRWPFILFYVLLRTLKKSLFR